MPPETTFPDSVISPAAPSWSLSRQLRLAALCTIFLVVCFAKPLYDLARFALHSELYSYILLVPLVSVYLVWTKRSLFPLASAPDRRLCLLPCLGGLASLGGYTLALYRGWIPRQADYLACMTLTFVLLLLGGISLFVGKQTIRAAAFPLAFLVFMVPLPTSLEGWLEAFLQHRSADAAALLFGISGMPLLRQGMDFQLPNIGIKVAPACSGIHSSLVLFITSLVAAYLFLRTNWSRALLVLCVIPLGILRNGFRIFVLGELCVNVDPGWIDSPLHHQGGWIFFAISIIPLSLLLWGLRKLERGRDPTRR